MNDRNYQRELDSLIKKNEEAGFRPRLLLHACCAPCSSYVIEYLSSFFDITLFYFNPNIDTREEHDMRRDELERLVRTMKMASPVKVVSTDFEPERFLEIARGHEKDPERGARCMLCYELRLRATAQFVLKSHEEGIHYDYFATTLTLSPLKNAKALNSIGESIGREYGIAYLPSDFKKKDGYKRSIELSAEYGLYRQNYCGCTFSKSVV